MTQNVTLKTSSGRSAIHVTTGPKAGKRSLRIKGQVIAIALVIATGVTLLVMMAGVINSLEETRGSIMNAIALVIFSRPSNGLPPI